MNVDERTVASFGDEWSRFDQTELPAADLQSTFEAYFSIFPWGDLAPDARGFDMGCGSGRWAELVAPRVGFLTCVDASADALAVARRRLSAASNVGFVEGRVDDSGIEPASQDFGYSLGVLHHVPDTAEAFRSCAALLKPGAPFLAYIYYRFDNRPAWFRGLWALSDIGRRGITKLPPGPRVIATNLIAALVYWPLARLSLLLERLGLPVGGMPLSYYRDKGFYMMRTDSRDRFGTFLEQRFTRTEIVTMMRAAGFEHIRFSEREPFWCALGIKGS